MDTMRTMTVARNETREQDMPERSQSSELKPGATPAGVPSVPAARSGGNRSADVRDAMAEMAERAHLISQEAGTKISAAMKDVIGAAAGIAGFAVESARDLVQYMVRRGQMTQDEADKLIREAEDAQGKRSTGERSRAAAQRSAAVGTLDRGSAVKAEAVARESNSREVGSPSRNSTAKRVAAGAPSKSVKKSVPKSAAEKRPAAKKAASKKRR